MALKQTISRETCAEKSGNTLARGVVPGSNQAQGMARAALGTRWRTALELSVRALATDAPIWAGDLDDAWGWLASPSRQGEHDVFVESRERTGEKQYRGSGTAIRLPRGKALVSATRKRLDYVVEYLSATCDGGTHPSGHAMSAIEAVPTIAAARAWLAARQAQGEQDQADSTPHYSRYWALSANPDIYRVEDAVRDLDEDWWTTKRSALSPGDRVVVWKARGSHDQRGIVALGTVLTERQVRSDDPDNPYWLDLERGQKPELRVLVRYEHASGLPLWEDEPGNEMLGELSVAQARGGSVFHVTEEQWAAIAALAELTTEHDSDQTTRMKRRAHRIGSAYREAVEVRAMEEAKRYFRERGWYLGPEGDVSEQRGLGYDLLFTRGTEELHVEAKGTSGSGAVVTLTRNEVDHAREYSNFALFVLSDIAVSQSDDGKFTATDGQERVLAPLRLDDEGALAPSQYSYRLPPRGRGQRVAAVRAAASPSTRPR